MFYETRLIQAQIDRYTALGHWKNKVLHDSFLQHAARSPEKTAIVDRNTRYTYRHLLDLSDRVALGFLDLGIRPGDMISVQLPNWNEFVIVALATERIGAVLGPHATILREREMLQMLTAARSRLLVVPDSFRGFDHAQLALQLKEACPYLEHLLVVGDAAPEGTIPWRDFVNTPFEEKMDKRWLPLLRPDPNQVAMVAFTSGTTGVPKGVLQTHNTQGCIIDSTVQRQGFNEDIVVHMASPLGHAIGYYWGVRMPLQVGGTAVYQDVWDPAEAVRLIERERATFSMGTTPFLADLLEAPNLKEHDVSSLSVFLCGGADIPSAIAARAIERLPSTRLCPLWGMTECGIGTGTDVHSPPNKVVASDGSPQPEMEIRIVDEHGRAVPPRKEGSLWIRSPLNFVGYIQGREFSEQFFPEDDWFDTGDKAYVDEDGYIRITGRAKDIIIRGGENIPVKEIEDILLRHPKVQDIAIVAMPDPRLGERACACIIPRAGQSVTLEDLRGLLAAEKVTKQFWPERVELYQDFPRTPSQKVQKFALREDVARRVKGDR